MKANRFIKLGVFLLIATVLAEVSCKKDEEKLKETEISLNNSTLTMVLGIPDTLLVSPDKTPGVVWSSSNTDVVTVDKGIITTVGLGDATINAVLGKSRAFCTVTVIKDPVKVTGVSLTKTETTIVVGGKETLAAGVTPDNATKKNVLWSSSNAAIASVDKLTGEVTGVSKGEATITASTVDGGKTATCLVKVWPGLKLDRPFANFTFNLNPTNAAENVAFSWIPVTGTTVYILKMSLTQDIQSPVFTKEVNGTATTVSSFELNELLKSLPAATVKVYWTVQPKDPAVNVIGEIRMLTIVPDKFDYLKLLPASASNMTVTKGAGEYQYTLSSGGSGTSTVNTSALTAAINPDSIMLSVMYKSATQIAPVEISFIKAGGTVAGSITSTAIPSSTNWKEFSMSIKQAVRSFSWGAAGDYLKLSFGANSQAEVNGLHFRGMTFQEGKDSYVPQILTIGSPNTHLTLETVAANHYKIVTTNTDPNVRTANLTENLPKGAVMLTFEYKSSKPCLNNLQIYFASPGLGLAEGRSIKLTDLNAVADWTVYSTDITTAITTFPWGVAGSYMRLDFGNFADYTIEFRNMKIVFK